MNGCRRPGEARVLFEELYRRTADRRAACVRALLAANVRAPLPGGSSERRAAPAAWPWSRPDPEIERLMGRCARTLEARNAALGPLALRFVLETLALDLDPDPIGGTALRRDLEMAFDDDRILSDLAIVEGYAFFVLDLLVSALDAARRAGVRGGADAVA